MFLKYLSGTVTGFFCSPLRPDRLWDPPSLLLNGYRRLPGVKRPGREADQSSPSSAEVKNVWIYTYTPQYSFMAWCLIKHRHSFTFIFIKLAYFSKLSCWAGYVARMGEMRTTYRILVGKPEEKELLGMSRHRQEDNIKLELKLGVTMWTGFVSFRIEANGRFF
jgi:hypothetical protein